MSIMSNYFVPCSHLSSFACGCQSTDINSYLLFPLLKGKISCLFQPRSKLSKAPYLHIPFLFNSNIKKKVTYISSNIHSPCLVILDTRRQGRSLHNQKKQISIKRNFRNKTNNFSIAPTTIPVYKFFEF